MKTFEQFAEKPENIPAYSSWILADLSEARGKQDLFIRQSPQRLKVLREHALIESAISSNRIEGVTVEPERIKTILFGRKLLRDRDEEEVRGYRKALNLIHQQREKLSISIETILLLHHLARAEIGDAGQFKERDSDIIETSENGRSRVRFRTVTASETPRYMNQLIALWHQALQERWMHPLIALAAFNLDFLCIHPFRDGNGRVSRLLFLLQAYHLEYEVGRYISFERIIEQNKERYYETLHTSSQNWHEGKHNPWPAINYLWFILKNAYKEFEERANQTKTPRGAKTELIESEIQGFADEFTLSELERKCPGVSHDMIRRVLMDLKKKNKIKCLGRGPGARWKRKGNASKKR